jgi:ankyrin repeat protein
MNLEQQKKRARELLQAIRAGHADALARLRRHHTRWDAVDDSRVRQQVALHDAQFALAREQGFASWPKLKAFAGSASDVRHTRLFVPEAAWVADRVQGLLRTKRSGVPAALEQIRAWHPRFADASDADILRAPFSEDDARLVYAREHGFDSWDELTSRADALRERRAHEPFLDAFTALTRGDVAALQTLLRAHPELARARGTNGNTLLNLEGSLLGSERKGGRSDGAAAIGLAGVEALLAAGADPDDANDRGWTPLHQAGYSNQPELAERLLAAGASPDLDAHGSGGTPLVVALFWGHREVANRLAAHAVTPRNLRVAAGIGDRPLVGSFFAPDGCVAEEAGAARGFYRPHSGFPDWVPSTSVQEVLDEALVWACKSDRVEVLERLVHGGARVDADPYRGTPLAWAAWCNRVRAVEWLVSHGADVNQRGTFGGLSHGKEVTALHLAAQCGHLDMVKRLVALGADPSMQEGNYHATALGWAEHDNQGHIVEFLQTCTPRT